MIAIWSSKTDEVVLCRAFALLVPSDAISLLPIRRRLPCDPAGTNDQLCGFAASVVKGPVARLL